MNTDSVLVFAIAIAIAALVPIVVATSLRLKERLRNKSIALTNTAAINRPISSEHPSVAKSNLEPHMHVVDGVVITHAHAKGDQTHEHSSITVSMSHYAELVKRAQQRQSG